MRLASDFSLSDCKLPMGIRRIVQGKDEYERCLLLLYMFDIEPELIAKNRHVFEHCRRIVSENKNQFIVPVEQWFEGRKKARGW